MLAGAVVPCPSLSNMSSHVVRPSTNWLIIAEVEDRSVAHGHSRRFHASAKALAHCFEEYLYYPANHIVFTRVDAFTAAGLPLTISTVSRKMVPSAALILYLADETPEHDERTELGITSFCDKIAGTVPLALLMIDSTGHEHLRRLQYLIPTQMRGATRGNALVLVSYNNHQSDANLKRGVTVLQESICRFIQTTSATTTIPTFARLLKYLRHEPDMSTRVLLVGRTEGWDLSKWHL